jgi:OmpA-like transmembrane domain
MKKILFALMGLGLTFIAHAQTNEGTNKVDLNLENNDSNPFYIGVGATYVALQDSSNALTNSMVNLFGGSASSGQSSSVGAGRIFAGYKVDNSIGFELGYLQTGNINASSNGNSRYSVFNPYDGKLYNNDAASINTSITGFDFGLIYKPKINETLDGLFVNAGATYFTTGSYGGVSLSTNNQGVSLSKTGYGYFAGLGYDFAISKSLNLRAAYTYYGNISTDSTNNANAFSLALVWGGNNATSADSNSESNYLASNKTVSTVTGNEVGILLSGYTYLEPSIVSIKGALIGVEYERTQAFEDFFLKGDVIYKQGSLSYSGSGVQDGIQNYYYDIRGLVGKDYAIKDDVVAPFTGLGYRYLYDDQRGLSSTSQNGYRREISYLYLPLGLIHRTLLDNSAKLETQLEYDYLIKGIVNTHLSDINTNTTVYPDITNNQTSGWGMRLSTSYQKNNWALTPYFNYWFIQNSDYTTTIVKIGNVNYKSTIWEPTNRTVEYGIKASFKF